ncbi:Polymerase/histidinol phosphatase-like protein [Syncephalis pseudoplumigaleata]|uniref:Polymerase/histidinol phosphatase-like protein n=1 Tax=Syncephalis pseudoplumigaleata TaxID=1712513 RepID=A0A4P9Z1X9_9FUNG|nr:Polymerase/histidinol phosphatase-like protein [Syncephalis pseudoplumigaleata]|eukprot:RKP26355.1 Polymerase/histidinol phosphatase-like protein [Syncephalis pseudoplumigaleata]
MRLCQIIAFLAGMAVVALLLNAYIEPGQYDYQSLVFDDMEVPRSELVPIGLSGSTDNATAYNIRLDGHAHTTMSDGRLRPDQLVDWAVAHGYNAIVVSDHNTLAGGLHAEAYARRQYPGRLLVIPAQEYSCCRIHMNLINIRTRVPVRAARPTNRELQRVIDEVHRQGGLAVVNHIPWSRRTARYFQVATLPGHPTLDELIDMGIDGVELVNGDTFDYPSFQALQQRMRTQPDARPLFAITGSDLHSPDGAYAWTIMQAGNFSVAAIMEEMRAGRTRFLFDPAGTRLRSYPGYHRRWEMLAPFVFVSDYLAAMYEQLPGMPSFQGEFCQTTTPQFHGYMLVALILGSLAIWLCFEAVQCALVHGWRMAARKWQARLQHK